MTALAGGARDIERAAADAAARARLARYRPYAAYHARHALPAPPARPDTRRWMRLIGWLLRRRPLAARRYYRHARFGRWGRRGPAPAPVTDFLLRGAGPGRHRG